MNRSTRATHTANRCGRTQIQRTSIEQGVTGVIIGTCQRQPVAAILGQRPCTADLVGNSQIHTAVKNKGGVVCHISRTKRTHGATGTHLHGTRADCSGTGVRVVAFQREGACPILGELACTRNRTSDFARCCIGDGRTLCAKCQCIVEVDCITRYHQVFKDLTCTHRLLEGHIAAR